MADQSNESEIVPETSRKHSDMLLGLGASEIVYLTPKLLWFIFAVVVFIIAYQPLLDRLKSGDVSKISFAAFQVEFARNEFSKAANKTSSPPREFSYYAGRIERLADKIPGTRGLWVDDKNPAIYFPERRALSALGISFDLAKNNDEMQQLFDAADAMNSPYDFVISDFVRDPKIDATSASCFPFTGSPNYAGCKTLQIVIRRYPSRPIPVIFYSKDGDQNGTPPGAFGATSKFDNLISLVLDTIEKRSPRPAEPLAGSGTSKG